MWQFILWELQKYLDLILKKKYEIKSKKTNTEHTGM